MYVCACVRVCVCVRAFVCASVCVEGDFNVFRCYEMSYDCSIRVVNCSNFSP